MLEALWSVEFQSNMGVFGNGIVVFETGRIFGGDSTMIYTGSFGIVNDTIVSELHVRKYASIRGVGSAVGFNDFHLKLTGKPDPKVMHLTGYVVEDPNRKMTIKATRQAELP